MVNLFKLHSFGIRNIAAWLEFWEVIYIISQLATTNLLFNDFITWQLEVSRSMAWLMASLYVIGLKAKEFVAIYLFLAKNVPIARWWSGLWFSWNATICTKSVQLFAKIFTAPRSWNNTQVLVNGSDVRKISNKGNLLFSISYCQLESFLLWSSRQQQLI